MQNIIKEIEKGIFTHAYLITGGSSVARENVALKFIETIYNKEGIPFLLTSVKKINDANILYIDKEYQANYFKDVKKRERKNIEISIDIIREVVIPFIQKTSFRKGKKILIIDQIENLSDEAADAFLKNLEEPPESTMIILLGVDPNRLKETIKSRCVCYNLASTLVQVDSDIYEGAKSVISRTLKKESSYGTIKLAKSIVGNKNKIDENKCLSLCESMLMFIRDLVVSDIENSLVYKKENVQISNNTGVRYKKIMVELVSAIMEAKKNFLLHYNTRYTLNKLVLDLYNIEEE